MAKVKHIKVCPVCFSENVMSRFGEGAEFWVCKDCTSSFPSPLEFKSSELESIRAEQKERSKKLPELVREHGEIDPDYILLRKLTVLLLGICFLVLIILLALK